MLLEIGLRLDHATMRRCGLTDKELTRYKKYENAKSSGHWSCWMWLGCRFVKRGGYGIFSLRGRGIRAHRLAYELYVGKIPRGKWVLHHCDTPPCVNPEHLFLGDNGVNMRDAVAKGRHVPPRGEKNCHTHLTEDDVRRIRFMAQTMSRRHIGFEYGMNQASITNIVNRKRWAHVV